jgi:membrane associated rhomboid family serine protease
MQSSIGGLIAMNLVVTFLLPGISIGGHVGGLVGGAAAGFIALETERQQAMGIAAVAMLALALFGAGLVIA